MRDWNFVILIINKILLFLEVELWCYLLGCCLLDFKVGFFLFDEKLN